MTVGKHIEAPAGQRYTSAAGAPNRPPFTYDINPTSHTLAPQPRMGEPADGLRDALADRYRPIGPGRGSSWC